MENEKNLNFLLLKKEF